MIKRRVVWNRPTAATPEAVVGRQRPPSPKGRVEQKARDLWGADCTVEVKAEQVRGLKRATELHLPNGVFRVVCLVNGEEKATAWHLKRGRAFRGLLGELEKKFESELFESRDRV